MRWLLPYFAYGSWSGSNLPDRDGDANGFYWSVQWFGVLVEISIGRVS